MSAPKIEADYDLLEQIAQKFTQQCESATEMLQNVQGKMDALQGEWLGEGSDSFFAEMGDLVLPGLNKLRDALEEAGSTTRQISDVMKAAEEDASAAFQCIA